MSAASDYDKLVEAKDLVQRVRDAREADDEIDDVLDTVTERLGYAQSLLDEEAEADGGGS